MTINEIAMALTAYLCIVFGDRIAKSVQKPVMAFALPALLHGQVSAVLLRKVITEMDVQNDNGPYQNERTE